MSQHNHTIFLTFTSMSLNNYHILYPNNYFPNQTDWTAGPDLLDYSNYVFTLKLNENLLTETDARAALGNKSNIQ